MKKDPAEGDITAPHSTSPPRVLCPYQQHVDDYNCLFMEGEKLTLGEDQATPLIIGVFFQYYFIDLFTVLFPSHVLHNSISQSPFPGPAEDMFV